jgi:hypothetical protein
MSKYVSMDKQVQTYLDMIIENCTSMQEEITTFLKERKLTPDSEAVLLSARNQLKILMLTIDELYRF